MSPRGASSANASSSKAASAPYSRRTPGQPKSSRQQFSACGACRMRSDEFADVKAVKLLRRGRRLQQVEAIYGKAAGQSSASPDSTTRTPSIIPQLAPEFFTSPFWSWFTVQRPVLDPVDFPARYISHTKGISSLSPEGNLIATTLVVWASSFGLDERGVSDADDLHSQIPSELELSSKRAGSAEVKGRDMSSEQKRRDHKERTEAMLREILEQIDLHGIMRRPSWDGLRVLLLVLPLLEDAHPLERLAIYEATLSQTQALCTMGSPSSSSITSFPDSVGDDVLVRARIFWYAHMQEGISTAMRGGRLVLDNDDFESFQHTLPSYILGPDNSGLGAPPSPPESLRPMSSHGLLPQHSNHSLLNVHRAFAAPLNLSVVCRKVHAVLTGPKATRRAEEHGLIDAGGMREIWDELDQCWEDFDAMRRRGTTEQESLSLEQYASAWQIYIFECHNNIRESLKQSMSRLNDHSSQTIFTGGSPSRPSSHSSSSPYLSPHHLHVIATRKCLALLPLVLRIIKFHLTQDERGLDHGGLFKWDSGLVRDGCFFAAYLAASVEDDSIDLSTDERDDDLVRGRHRLSTEEGVALCLTAIAEMKWAFSRSEEREETVRMVWENRKVGRNAGRYSLSGPLAGRVQGLGGYPEHSYNKHLAMPPYSSHGYSSLQDRPLLPPLRSPRRAESAPTTAYSTTGHGAHGWPSYTPPGTGTSVATSATGVSINPRGSPLFNSMTGSLSYKTDPHEPFYHVPVDVDHFSFHAPPGPGLGNSPTVAGAPYHHRDPPSSAHSLHSTTSSSYLDPAVFASTGSSIVQPTDAQGCPQFGDDCNSGYYH
ncbi:hypothetical protein H0H81_001430 [Sphagnurus paluster]|uniref:Uncharacterized protein n=1 Tax=Sphagnurus paluster TaxID=117069 RepID=A0A9P7GPX2_9AGAR|nr:hypothetical protein H0H81_001430 [Sphagnurus paluster]